MKTLSIAVFGICGVLARYLVGLFTFSKTFPFSTLLVNLVGAFLIGIVHEIGNKHMRVSEPLKTGLMVGFLGGFTTFSSYCLEALQLLEQGSYLPAAVYFVASPVLGLVAAYLGIGIARAIINGLTPIRQPEQEFE